MNPADYAAAMNRSAGAGSSGPAGTPNPAEMSGMMSGNGSGPGGNNGKPTFKNPVGAVTTFLNAVKKKDPEAIAEATALRAGQPTETSPHYQKIFTAILEQSLAPEDLDEFAKKFEGMSNPQLMPALSTGRASVVISKAGKSSGAYFTRTIVVRKEKAGWKVVDVSGLREFKAPMMMRNMGQGTGRRPGR